MFHAATFGVGLLLLSFKFYSILAFGSAKYDKMHFDESELV